MTDISRIADALEGIQALLQSQQAAPSTCLLMNALWAEFGTTSFLAREAMERAQKLRDEAQMRGQRLPDLPHELERAKIDTVRALARWLTDRQGRGVEKAAAENGAVIWALTSAGGETRDHVAAAVLDR